MRPHLFALTVAAAAIAACDLSPSNPVPPILTATPVLDSVFVGDSLPPRMVTLYDANLNPQNPGRVTWSIDPNTVATIDTTGKIHGLQKGAAVITAHAAGLTAPALVIVSRRLDLTLLLDTVYLMPQDTFTIPLAIKQKAPAAMDTVWFDPSPQPNVYTITTDSGFVTALGLGGYIPYVAHVATSTDTVVDTGMVRVMQLTDTTGGRFYMTILGTAIRHEGGAARAMNYLKADGLHRGFRLTDSLFNADTTFYEKLQITLPDSVIGTGPFEIDTLNPNEASSSVRTIDAFCRPLRPWAVWSHILPIYPFSAFSNTAHKSALVAGQLGVTQYVTLPSGHAISGRFLFTAQRTDLYYDTLGIETIRGTFVAPLVANSNACPR